MADNIIGIRTKEQRAKGSGILMIVCGLIAALFWVWPRIQLLISRPTEAGMLHPAAVPFSWLNLTIFVAYVAALIKFSRTTGPARYMHLVLLFIMTISVLIHDFEFIMYYVIPTSETDEQFLSSPAIWWGMSDGVRWSLWFAFNAWYFIRRPGKTKR